MITSKHAVAGFALAVALAACESGDINLQPTNVDNSTTMAGGGSGGSNPCAAYVDPTTSTTRQGSFDGTNCTYGSTFVSFASPLTVNLNIPFITGTHIFQDTLAVGANVSSGPAPAGGTGPTLTIEAGATLAFSDSADYLLINRGSQIIAQGSPSAPITFTSFTDAVTGTAGPESVAQWGGVVINGNGITNNCTDTQRANDDCHVVSEGQPSNYGGNDNADSSGSLRYVVVKHTGFEAAPGDELNGITFNAVGSGTEVSHVEAYSTFDDGIEFFGGAVNVDHFVALYVKDDSIDFSDGYVGTVDTALVIHSLLDGNRCIEGDNIGEGRANAGEPLDAPPVSRPTIRNMTCIVSQHDAGTHDPSEGPTFRRGPQFVIENSIVWGGYADDSNANNECFEIDDGVTRDFAQAGDSLIANSLIVCELATQDDLENGDTIREWYLGANPSTHDEDYSFNANNTIIDGANLASTGLVGGLDSFYTADCDVAAMPPTCTFADNMGAPVVIALDATNPLIGAVTRADDWTQNWTYGLFDGLQGQALWFGNP